jgi:hypothetical protein
MLSKEWLAGFFDGEGCVYLQASFRRNRKLPRFSLQVCITQNDQNILEKIKSEYGGQVYKHSGKRCYRWRVVSVSALKFLEVMLPYVLIKKEQVVLAIQFAKTLRHENLGSIGMGPEVNSLRMGICNRLKELKHSVCPDKIPETAGSPERVICNEASQEERSETIMGTPKGDGIVRHSEESEITGQDTATT